jgi:aspartate aminotransferase
LLNSSLLFIPLEVIRALKGSEELSKRLLEDIGVALLPGSDFYMPDEFLGVRVTSVDYDGAKLMHDFSITGKEKPLMYTSLFPRLAEACERLEKWLR